MKKGYVVGTVALAIVGVVMIVGRGRSRAPARRAHAIVAELRALPASPLRIEFPPPRSAPLPAERREVANAPEHGSARVTVPDRATQPLKIESVGTGMTIGVQARDVADVAGEQTDGYYVYPQAHASGGSLLHRVLDDGVEDFVSFDTRPAAAKVSYDLSLDKGVAGLRLVAGTLEILDANGAPRLRAAPPYIVGADGARTDAALALEGCEVDTNPAAPWGRAVSPPGASVCHLEVTWPTDGVVYPAVLDPRWTTTGTMIAARQDHTATLLSNNKVLVAGGRATNTATAGIGSAELFDPTTSTWAATAAGMVARFSASATQLNTSSNSTTSGMVLIAGGINNSASVTTAQFYSATTGLWTTAASLNVARHLHTATLMPNGNVLVAGGMTNTTVLNSAAIYNPTTGMGTWTAVSTTMSSARRSHTATLLSSSNTNFNNKVLIVGGNSGGTTSLTTVQLFDTTALTWSTTTALSPAREGHTATKLANGNVLITGGKNVSTFLGTAQVFTIPASGTAATWASAGTMNSLRWAHTATLLSTSVPNNGSVLVVGGSNGTNPVTSADLWNGTTTWTATTALTTAVQAHTATLLTNGGVVIAGGSNNGTASVAAGVVYDPSFALSCTSNSQCTTGFCVNGVCCNTACTNQCSACNLAGLVGTCSPKTNGTTCNDGNACTQTDTCQSGTCTGSNPVTCTAQDQCHVAGTCNTSTGVCSNPTATNGTTCNDGNACTRTDTCQSGTCTGGNPVTCTAQDQCHVAGTCNTSTGVCSNPTAANGTTCNDGNACTRTDTCQSGTCTGGNPVTCTAQDQCHVAGTCNTSTGVCSNPTAANGTTCNDGNACTTGDACESGTCTGTAVTCTAQDQCHAVGTCNPSSGVCSNPNKANGTTCSDGNSCTTGDACQSGTCTGTAVTCTAQDQCHSAGTCNPSTGTCSNPTLADGASCNDGNACTQTDACLSGVCTGSNPVTCTAEDQCHTPGTCIPSTGVCSNPAAANGVVCNDGNSCTQGETCQSGACQAGTSPVVTGLAVDDLGNLGGGFAEAEAVNAPNQVVGVSATATGDSHAFIWDGAAPMIDLGGGSGWPAQTNATAISSSGALAGSATQPDGSSHVFIDVEGFVDLGPGGDNSVVVDTFDYQGGYAYGMDDAWDIAGVMTVGGAFHGFLYQSGAGFQDIGSLGGAWTWANGISPTGTVVGSSQLSGSPTTGYLRFGHAVSYNPTIGLRDLNTFVDPMEGITLVTANGANNFFIVGGAQKSGPTIPYRLNTNTGELDQISAGWQGDTVAYSVNDVGDTVGLGYLDAADTQQAPFIYTDQLGFKNLNDLIDPASGWTLQAATGINASDDVVGWGYHNGQFSAFHLRVSPAAIAGAEANSCGSSEGSLYLWSDGVVDQGNGTYVAVFGFNNGGTASIAPTTDEELIDGSFVSAPNPTPPTMLPPGSHPGAFLPTFQLGQTVSWVVNGQTVTASAATGSRVLPPIALGTSGSEVNVEGTDVVITPDLSQYGVTPPSQPSGPPPQLGSQYYGTLKGTLGVSPSGAATYTVPLTIPPGVGGMAPNLSLTYNSQAGDGIAGQGWSLGGLSVINRCPKTATTDGQPAPIQMTANDGVCLDGKRLINVPNSTTSFQLETADFSTITAYNGQSTFKVTTKTGETRYYGLRSESRVTLPTYGNDQPGIVIWGLDRVEDRWGNYYDIHYNTSDQPFSEDGLLVTSIQYTGHSVTSGDCSSPPNTCPANTISFEYDSNGRVDARQSHYHYSTLFMSQRLKTIGSYVTTSNSGTSVGYYTLNYLPDDPMLPSRLGSISYQGLPNQTNPPPLLTLTFAWDAGYYGWTEKDSYALPVPLNLKAPAGGNGDLSGVQFVDLDGDGRVDLVQSRDAASDGAYPAAYKAWHNNGNGWDEMDNWTPGPLVGSDGKPKTFLADLDGDGILDELTTSNDGTGSPVGYYNRIRGNPNCAQGTSTPCWEWDKGKLEATYPSTWGPLAFQGNSNGYIDTVIDINGDGLADIVRRSGADGIFSQNSISTNVDVLTGEPFMNFGFGSASSGWGEDAVTYMALNSDGSQANAADYVFQDVNRDGLPDLVGQLNTSEFTSVYLNVASRVFANGSAWSQVSQNDAFGAKLPSYLATDMHIGDVDGDGLDDIVEDLGSGSSQQIVALGTGSTFTTNWASWVQALSTYGLPPNSLPIPGFITMADINGDGLVDALMPPSACQLSCGPGPTGCPPGFGTGGPIGSQLLINSGGGWADPSGHDFLDNCTNTDALPIVVAPDVTYWGNQFVDLDGDGLVDIVQASDNSGSFVSQAWMNTFHRPVITGFPNAQATPTIVDYAVITTGPAQGTNSVYDDNAPISLGIVENPDGSVAPILRDLTSPLRVVSDIKVDAGLGPQGPKALTSYHYSSLRGTAKRGAVGFASISTTNPLGTVTTTTYSQNYPFTGLPTSVTKAYNVGDGQSTVQYDVTNTTYCAYQMNQPGTSPGTITNCQYASIGDLVNTSWFVYPTQIVDTITLESGTAADRTASNPFTTVTTTYTYDDKGNPTLTTVDTKLTTPQPKNQAPLVEEWSKTVQDDFGAENSANQVLGKPLSTTVTTTEVQPASLPKKHVSGFSYTSPAVSMDEIAGTPVTGIVLNQLDSEQGAGYPIELFTTYGYDVFGNVTSTTACDNGQGGCRTSSVSYDPAAFVAPSGSGLQTSISYQNGLFPVSKTNAMNQVEYFVYDPNSGGLLQDTDLNGITTCYAYDAFGHKTSETDRCGSGTPIETLYTSYLPADPAAPYAAGSVSVTYPPDGKTSWTYMDTVGREIETLTQSFGGTLTETLTGYNPIGQVSSKTQPFFVNDPIYYTQYHYDGLNRTTLVTQDIGDIGNGQHSVAVKQTTYQGTSTTTNETVNQNSEIRTETKNAIGKVATTVDAAGGGGTYAYDSDGNLLTYTDNTTGLTQVTNQFDNRGRRSSMVDLDLGSWTYNYDGFSDVVVLSDSLSQVTTMNYDALGRMTSRTDPTGTAKWVYDYDANAPGSPTKGKLVSMISAPDAKLLGFCTIPNIDPSVMTGNRAGKYYTYDSFGELQNVSECVDGETLTTSYQYDGLGRQSYITYPQVDATPVTVGYTYTPNGYLQYVTDVSNASVLWTATGTNALGQVTSEYTANGVETVKSRNPSTGWLMSSSSLAQANNNQLIQSWSYQYDEAGDLLVRDRQDALNTNTSHETFGYDLDNRLQTATTLVGGQSTSDSYFYDLTGNITTKDGYTYQYGSACPDGVGYGPHAVCGVTDGSTFAYDGNGNMISGRNRIINYNPQNKVSHVESDPAVPQGNNSGSADFMYGADGNRVVQSSVTTGNGQTTTARTLYFGLDSTGHSLFESTATASSTQHVYYLYAGTAHGGSPFAVRVITDSNPASTSAAETRYYHYDHLGSVTAMSDESGQVISSGWGGADATQLGYDAWGARRNPDETPATPANFDLLPGHREFTGQETIPFVGIVNLNGRVYDPILGRFLTPDPNVQFIADPQSFNRYSYVLNNPLRYIDPTGYFSFDQWWGKWGQTIVNDAMNIVSGVIIVGACFGSGGVGCAPAIIAMGIIDSSAMHAEGASWSQAITYTAIGEGSALAGGGLSYGLMPLDPLQTSALQAVEQGAIGGAGSAAFNVIATGQIGWNTLATVGIGAFVNGVSWGIGNYGTTNWGNWGIGGSGGEGMIEAFTYGGAVSCPDEMVGDPNPVSLRPSTTQLADGENPAGALSPPVSEYDNADVWTHPFGYGRVWVGPGGLKAGGASFDPPTLNPSTQATMLPQNMGVVIQDDILGTVMGALASGGVVYSANMSPGIAVGNQSGVNATSGVCSAEILGVFATGRSSLADGFATPNDLASAPH